MHKLTRDIRDVKRISHVIQVLFSNGLGYVVEEMKLKYHLPLTKRLMKHKYKRPLEPEVRLRKVLEQLGGSYVKLGQLLSLRPDKIPMKYCDELSKLQDRVRGFGFDYVKKTVEKDLGKPLKDVFKSFDKVPIASASIGQVHKAVLKNGKKVAVKVQRPHIKEIIESDLDIMYYFANEMERRGVLKRYNPLELVKEFERYSKDELNYLMEAKNIEDFYQNFKKSRSVVIPKVYWDYTSRRVLTMEYLEGTKVSELNKSKKRFDFDKLTQIGVKAMIKQFYIDGLFHADAHPGNLLIMKGGKIGFLDFGIVGKLDDRMKYQSLRFAGALLSRDIEEAYKILLDMGQAGKDTDLTEFKKQVAYLIYKWHSSEKKHIHITHLMHQLFDASVEHGLHLPKDLVLVAKGLITVEGTYRTVNPDFDFLEAAKPEIKKIMDENMLSKDILRRVLSQKERAEELFFDVPEKFNKIMDRLVEGRIKMDIDDTDIKTLGWDIDKSSNRLSYGMMIAAFVVASGMIMIPNPSPLLMGVSYFSWIFFIAALVLGWMLFKSIKREGKYGIRR